MASTPKAIHQTKNGLTVGHAGFAARSDADGTASPPQATHDGDTLNVRAIGNFGVRSLGVDTPEVSLPLPSDKNKFLSIGGSEWVAFLATPPTAASTKPSLDPALLAHLAQRFGPDAAKNHAQAAEGARARYIALLKADRDKLGKSDADFRFFLAFATEVIDRYGRMLAYVNPDQPNVPKAQRLKSYNERLLADGWAFPYFIWPNVNPFRKQPSLLDAVPNSTAKLKDPTLDGARAAVKAARAGKQGVFAYTQDIIEPFELRYLSRGAPPDRWVINLASNQMKIYSPQKYHTIPTEDRLWVPAEYVELFVSKGWTKD